MKVNKGDEFMWKKVESENYIFNFLNGSIAEKEINEIILCQEGCFKYITNVLQTNFKGKIEYYLCETAKQVGELYGDNEPCNGFARLPNKIYAVYNNDIKCIGFHEDAHIISYGINIPNSAAIREGLSMFFDRKWHGLSNLDWVQFYINENEYISIVDMIEDEIFYNIDCNISYPIMGAFTEYLILRHGIEKYKKFYSFKEIKEGFLNVFGHDIEVFEKQFKEYMSLVGISEELLTLMKKLK